MATGNRSDSGQRIETPAALREGPAPTAAVSYVALLLFYLPLGFSGLMMTLDQPVVISALNRLPNPDTSVAALRVAFSLALVYEASHISMIDVSTALSGDLRVFYMLRRFYVVMSGVLLVSGLRDSLLTSLRRDSSRSHEPDAAGGGGGTSSDLGFPAVAYTDRLAQAAPGRAHQARPPETRGCGRVRPIGFVAGIPRILRVVWNKRGEDRACGYRRARHAGERHRRVGCRAWLDESRSSRRSRLQTLNRSACLRIVSYGASSSHSAARRL